MPSTLSDDPLLFGLEMSLSNEDCLVSFKQLFSKIFSKAENS